MKAKYSRESVALPMQRSSIIALHAIRSDQSEIGEINSSRVPLNDFLESARFDPDCDAASDGDEEGDEGADAD